ncbi:MAG: peptide-methionine (S)-S-oxide reductase MsrA [Phyllobacteriaceae bacterium]|nr:peptide-methionine (S)-S-oxide reductase MsrA [Phyllobacteriaceae bacterium]
MRSRILLSAILMIAAGPATAETRTALFAGGCFWCLEADMDHVRGVTATTSGYAGGKSSMPTYNDYESGDHREVVKVEFDDAVISYGDLVATFLRTIDVTDSGGQFCDRGHAYTSAVHALDEGQANEARVAIAAAESALGEKIVTSVEGPVKFWAAEEEHQNFHLGMKRRLTLFGFVDQTASYKRYRKGCGRDAQVKRVWGEEAYKGVDRAM